jgi:uncharacterized protein YggE
MMMNTKAASLLLATALGATAQAQFPSMANKWDQPPLVTVQGRGEVRAANTVASIQLGFEAAGPEEPAVRADVTQRSRDVTALLKEQQVERLETTAVNIRPQFVYDQGSPGKKPLPPKITGYTGQVTVSFRTPVTEAGKIISEAMAAGANSVSGMFTQPSDEARRSAESQALTLAAKDAEAQADALLAALDLVKVGVRSIDATGSHFEPRPMMSARMMAADAAPPLPELDVQGGETVISREVTLQVEFRPN